MNRLPTASTSQPSQKQRTLTRKELALMIFPGYSADTATQMLSRWIARDDDLRADLARVGFRSGQRILSQHQVDIFSDHFGLCQ